MNSVIQKAPISRRSFLRQGATAGLAMGLNLSLPAWARSGAEADLSGLSPRNNVLDLSVDHAPWTVDGRRGHAILVNGQLPAPLLRLQEGEEVILNVTNHLQEDTSIHWHGLLLPYQMDGVPGVSFPGIKPGTTFTYRFPVRQAGTYWYHSHSGLQEQQGHYGPIVIEPAGADPVDYDREFVIVLSDWSFEHPHQIFARLKKHSDVYNRQQRTLGEFVRDARARGWSDALAERRMWGAMRMNPTDLSDVTSATYTYLINGHSPDANWEGIFQAGERVRLRVINASAMSIFNVRIPGLPLTIVQADGLDVDPVETDEFQIGVAETFDAIVVPQDQAYTIFAETNDRSGFARATLTSESGRVASVPALRPRPTLTMKDMAMDHDGGSHGGGHGAHAHHRTTQQHDHATGPGVVGLADNPVNRLNERPLGLEDVPHRVLVYADLKSLKENPDQRQPGRTIELHLTSNMERYMWSFDGMKFSEVRDPIVFREGERLRLTMVNDTMMPHPIHLHGMFFDVVTDIAGSDAYKPRKHTIVVKPGEKMSVDVTADAPGQWAFHCHLLYHMHAGMMQTVTVRPFPKGDGA